MLALTQRISEEKALMVMAGLLRLDANAVDALVEGEEKPKNSK